MQQCPCLDKSGLLVRKITGYDFTIQSELRSIFAIISMKMWSFVTVTVIKIHPHDNAVKL